MQLQLKLKQSSQLIGHMTASAVVASKLKSMVSTGIYTVVITAEVITIRKLHY